MASSIALFPYGLLPLKPRNVAISELHVGILVVSPTRLARLRGRIAAFVGQIVILLVHAIDLVFFLEILIVRSGELRSEEHTSELQSLMRSPYAVFCMKK